MILESENTEFKAKLTDEIYKEVIAFANTDGGVIYIGVDDNGNVVGIDNVDDTYTRITNGIRDAIQPDVTMFVKYKLEDNRVVKITVGEGSYKPYYLKSKGLKPNGVYIRQGASSVQASSEQIRRMIKVSDGDSFEEMRSLEQELTFSQAEQAFQKYPDAKPLLHSDRGVQYTSRSFRKEMKRAGVCQSMSRVGAALTTPQWRDFGAS